jgi:hypothetical protein
MGVNISFNKSNISKNKKKCYEEIRFILKSFKNKYEKYDRIPKYGLSVTIDYLGNDSDKNRKIINEFIKNLSHWRSDMKFVMTVSADDTLENIYSSFIKDTFDLEDKIKKIIN